MRRNKAFPGPGDRVRLAIPQPNDESGLLVRYGTVIEKSIGRSSALKVRWDDTAGRSGFAADGGTEGWLADAAWYWDRAQLRVVHGDEADEVAAPVPVASRRAPAAPEEDGWLTAGPHAGGSTGRDGSRDAMAEWEAALASELEMGPDGDWEQLLARALHHGASGTPGRQPAAPARPTPPPAPAAPAAPSRPAPQAEARPTPPPAAAAEPVAPPAPPKPVQPWTGDDIIPRSGGKRRGRR